MRRQRILLSLAGASFAAVLLACSGGPAAKRGASTDRSAPQLADDATQAERAAIVEKATAAGVIRRLGKWEGIPSVWVEPHLFAALDYEEKGQLVGVIAAHEFRVAKGESLAPGELFLVRDAKTGKEIGHFDARGFHLD